jgi:capsular exopolysaccharide synthesis family protein
MSKIERALKKAEEERRKKAPPGSPPPSENSEYRPIIPVQPGKPQDQPPVLELCESFRKIATRLKLNCELLGVNDVLFTSAVSREGKTTTAANCAMSLSQDFNLSVCLVDCDLRNPRLSEFFHSNGGPSIVDVLKGQVEVHPAIQSTVVPNLSIMYSQRAGRSSLPLLNSEKLGNLVYELRSRFDFVIFDSPPVLPIADAVVLSKKVSAIVLVIEPGRTRRKHIEQILDQVDGNKVAGFIMNYKQYRVPQTYSYTEYYNYKAEADAPIIKGQEK